MLAGVLVPPSPSRARKWAAEIPEISVPKRWMAALEADPRSGVDLACQLALSIRASGAFDGIHLIPGVRYREVALRLDAEGWSGRQRATARRPGTERQREVRAVERASERRRGPRRAATGAQRSASVFR